MISPKVHDKSIETATRNIDSLGVVIMRDVHRFSRYGVDFGVPHITFVINTEGVAQVRYDEQEDIFRTNEVAVISPKHTLHVIASSEKYSMTLVILSERIVELCKTTALRHDHQKYHAVPNCILTERQLGQLLDVVKVLETVSDPNLEIEHREGAQCNLLHVFNELLMSFRPDDEDMQVTRSTFVFNRFMDLLAVNYKKEHEVQFYAQELCMTPKYFSKIVTDVTGRGANAWINEYITNKAKNMLRTRPDLTLHEIGNMLGFSEQAAFTRFFHKQTGFSPRSFRG